jgi:hypothetical protein
METSFNEEKFDRVQVYRFLYLDDSIALEEFKVKYGSSELSMRTRYLNALSDISAIEVPVLSRFLNNQKFVLKYPVSAFMRHSYLLAQSSSGKSEFIKHIFNEFLKLKVRKTLIMLEPHRDLSIEALTLKSLWRRGIDNVIYLDPDIKYSANQLCESSLITEEYCFSLNPFDLIDSKSDSIQFLVENISKAFFSIIKSEETFQMEAIIEACVETLLLRPNSDILDLKRFMDNSKNEDLVAFAKSHLRGERFELMDERFVSDPKIQQTKSSIYYRLQSILGKQELVNCLKGKRTVDLEDFMNSGKSIICNFSKAKLGPDGAPMLGKLFLALLSSYATLRQKVDKAKRVDTFVFMDEFQNYISQGTTEKLFAEQRKYKTYFLVANQQMGQSMTSEIKRLISGNTALKLMGDNESDSVDWFSKQFKRIPTNPTDNLPNYSFWFYDRKNKDLGSYVIKSPSYLVEKNEKYYLSKMQLTKAFNYLIHKSGLYYKVEVARRDIKNLDLDQDTLGHNFTS